jgi:ribosomal protein S25
MTRTEYLNSRKELMKKHSRDMELINHEQLGRSLDELTKNYRLANGLKTEGNGNKRKKKCIANIIVEQKLDEFIELKKKKWTSVDIAKHWGINYTIINRVIRTWKKNGDITVYDVRELAKNA